MITRDRQYKMHEYKNKNKKKKRRKQNWLELNCFRQPGYAKSLDGPSMRKPREVLTLCPLSYPCSALQSEGSTVTPKVMLRDNIDQITKPQLCFVFLRGGGRGCQKCFFFFYFFFWHAKIDMVSISTESFNYKL